MAKITGAAEQSPLTRVGMQMEGERRTDIRQQKQLELQAEMAEAQERLARDQMAQKMHVLQMQLRQEKEFKYFALARQEKAAKAQQLFDVQKWQTETKIDLAKLGMEAATEQRLDVESQADMYARYGLRRKTEDGRVTIEPVSTGEMPAGGTEGIKARTALTRAQTALVGAHRKEVEDVAKADLAIKKQTALIGAVQTDFPEWGQDAVNIDYVVSLSDSGLAPGQVRAAVAETVNKQRISQLGDVIYSETTDATAKARALFDLGNLSKTLGVQGRNYLSDKEGKARQKAASIRYKTAAKRYLKEIDFHRKDKQTLMANQLDVVVKDEEGKEQIGNLTQEYVQKYTQVNNEIQRRVTELRKIAGQATEAAVGFEGNPLVISFITHKMADAQIQSHLTSLHSASSEQVDEYIKWWDEKFDYSPSKPEMQKLLKTTLDFRTEFTVPTPLGSLDDPLSLLTTPAPGAALEGVGQIEKTGLTFDIEQSQSRLLGLGNITEF